MIAGRREFVNQRGKVEKSVWECLIRTKGKRGKPLLIGNN